MAGCTIGRELGGFMGRVCGIVVIGGVTGVAGFRRIGVNTFVTGCTVVGNG